MFNLDYGSFLCVLFRVLGDVELLIKCVEAMNAPCDDAEEERKGGAGDIGKMIFSINDDRVAIVAHVPESKKDRVR